MKVLILSVSAGGGHAKAAQTLKDYMDKYYNHIQVEVIDWLKYINPVVDRVVVGSYIGTLKTRPALYEKLYNIAEKDEISDISRTINRLLTSKMERLVEQIQPGVIVCTHPFPLEVACHLKGKNILSCKVVSLLTDFAPHSFWIRKGVDCYIIPHQDLTCEMEYRGVERSKIYPLGIPISQEFLKDYDSSWLRKDLGLKDKTTLLIMGGSLGLGEIKEVFTKLVDSSLDIQLIAVCGKNKRLKKELEAAASGSSKPCLILGYTSKVPQLMKVSDLLITKPGGITISEAMVTGLPVAIISPIPGQEERNAQYLLNSGMAIRFRSRDYVEGIIRQLLDCPVRLKHMKEIAALKAKPRAAEDICKLLVSLMV